MTETTMTAAQRIKRQILINAKADGVTITPDNIDELFDAANENWELQDDINEFRCSGVETPEIAAPYSRHLEADAVARKLDDGSWVGWVYWYGGGKHAEPEAVEWMNDAYDLELVETKTIEVNVFKKAEASKE